MAITEFPPPAKGDDSKEPAYLVLDTESVPDGRLLRLVKYAGETLTDAQAIDKASSKRGTRPARTSCRLRFNTPWQPVSCVSA